jgi:pimeloyl-ACP methyl ester carboxylesterase
VKFWFTDTGGTGTPIVLLHANTGTSASWEPQAAAFAREGYRVIAFDRRGWGKSLADPATGPQPGSVAVPPKCRVASEEAATRRR